jgi:hypothetical protein
MNMALPKLGNRLRRIRLSFGSRWGALTRPARSLPHTYPIPPWAAAVPGVSAKATLSASIAQEIRSLSLMSNQDANFRDLSSYVGGEPASGGCGS